MNKLKLNRNMKADTAALAASQLSPFYPTQSRRFCNVRIARPAARRHKHCRASRPVRAALHAAEFADWQSSGGGFLASMHQPVL